MKNNNDNQGNEKMNVTEEKEIALNAAYATFRMTASALVSVQQRLAAWKVQQDRKNSAK